MDITITINTDNAAFDIDPMEEVRAILRQAADHLDEMPVDMAENLYDTNGNGCGEVSVRYSR